MVAPQPTTQELPLGMVGSTVFGRYPKISVEQTLNMIISDDALVSFAGHRRINERSLGDQGRGIVSSSKANFMFLVVDSGLYLVGSNLSVQLVASLDTSEGDVYMDINNNGAVAISDGIKIYIYDYLNDLFYKPELDFIPGDVRFQSSRFVVSVANPNEDVLGFWRLSAYENGRVVFPQASWPNVEHPDIIGAYFIGEFETDADVVQSAFPVPSRGNNIFLFGKNKTELWVDNGQPGFPYLKNTTSNLDFGCLNAATIDGMDKITIWLGGSNKAGPTIMYSDGASVTQISTDGINYKLAQLTNPQDSYGFLFRQDGHLLYILTFYTDNISYAYDFNTQKFFTLTDENLNYYAAKRVVLFNEKYYFISINDGNLYELSSIYTTYDGAIIPRIRFTKHFRRDNQTQFCVNYLSFALEQGNTDGESQIEISLSVDGGESFGNTVAYPLNAIGRRPNIFRAPIGCMSNDFVAQIRYYTPGRAVILDGILSVYQ